MADKAETPCDVRCPICSAEFPESAIEGALVCPSCKCKSPPQLIAQDVELKINWQDVRILYAWARSWQMLVLNTRPEPSAHLDRIRGQFEAVRPKGAKELALE